MVKKNQVITGTLAALALLLLILDARTAVNAAKEGVSLCLYTVIPSLFPFIVFTQILNSTLSASSIPLLRPVAKLCGIPNGQEGLFLLGFLGGYPVGARNIYDAYRGGTLSEDDAKRMLGFCNNAGPSFIFGFLGGMFTENYLLWLLWLIHILSACIVGILLPKSKSAHHSLLRKTPVSLPEAVSYGAKTMGCICGWIVLFRILIAFTKRWFFFFLPNALQILLSGILELSNGCFDLYTLYDPGTQFVLATLFLSLGGLCVGMQTISVTGELGTGLYFPGKILHGFISVSLAVSVQFFLFPKHQKIGADIAVLALILAFGTGIVIWFAQKKKTVAIP